jgi:transcriptional regulator with XRE-family HTH domain
MTNTIRGHPLKIAREQRNLSQRQLATATGLARSTIQDAESGKRTTRWDVRQVLCEFFEKSPEELGFLSSDDDVIGVSIAPSVQLEKEDIEDMKRRELVKRIATVLQIPLFANFIDSEPWHRLVAAAQKSTQPDNQTLQHFSELTQMCWNVINGPHFVSEGSTITELLSTYLPQLTEVTDHVSKPHALSVNLTAQGYMIAAIVALDKLNISEMDSFSEKAVQYASRVEDYNLLAAAYKHRAIMFHHTRRVAMMYQSYQSVLPFIDKVSPLLRSRVYQGLAMISAQYGKEQDALRYLGLAKDTFPSDWQHDPSFLYSDTDIQQLYKYEGLTYLALNEPSAAWEALMHIDGLSPKIPTGEFTRIDFLEMQSRTAIMLRDIELCSTYFESLTTTASTLNSQYGKTKAHEVYDVMQLTWMGEPRVKALSELLYSA